MRDDMHKKIVERPKVGGGWAKVKAHRGDPDDEPTHASFRPRVRGWNLKEKHDHRAPLRRYLRSQVGRDWDEVYGDICARTDLRNQPQRNLRECVEYMVHTNVTVIDDEPRDVSGVGIWRDFWVHPQTGVLMAAPERPRYRWRGFRKNFEQVDIDSTHKYVRVDGIWYLVTFSTFAESEYVEAVNLARKEFRPQIYDVVFKEDLPLGYESAKTKLEREWGSAVYATTKRQLGKREIKKVTQVLARIKRDQEN